jgi:tetrahydromethanopterin S-methyltransferase subunit B
MKLSFATVYMLASHGDHSALETLDKLRATPGLLPYARPDGTIAARDTVYLTRGFTAQLVGAMALCGYVLGTTFDALLALS